MLNLRQRDMEGPFGQRNVNSATLVAKTPFTIISKIINFNNLKGKLPLSKESRDKIYFEHTFTRSNYKHTKLIMN